MNEGILISALAGVGLAIVYSAAATFLGRLAMRSSKRTFMMIVMGGMVARMFVALIILTLVLIFAPIHKTAFLLGFFVVFLIGMTIEILTLHRQQQATSEGKHTSA